MNYRVVLIIAIILFALVLLFGAIEKKQTNISKLNVSDNILDCIDEELNLYSKAVFINGKELMFSNSVVVYNTDIYVSIKELENTISSQFVSRCENKVNIRRVSIVSSNLIQNNAEVYIQLQTLEQFINVNCDVRKSNGVLYIDSMLPLSINFQSTRYYLTNISKSLSEVSVEPDDILSDGRGVWIENNIIWIENDWGKVYKFEKSKDTIC